MSESPQNSYQRMFKVPDYQSLFPAKLNPFDKSDKKAGWLKQICEFSLMTESHFKKIIGITQMVGLFFPFCPDIERYEYLFKILMTLFIIDDHSDRDDPELDISRDVARSEMIWGQMESSYDKMIAKDKFICCANWRPYVVYNYMIGDAICHEYNDHQKQRFAQLYKDISAATRLENRLFESRSLMPTFEECVKVRKEASAAKYVLQLIEYSDNICLTEEEWRSTKLQRLMDQACEAIAIDNDVYSFEKEYIEAHHKIEDMCFNVVAVIMQMEDCDIEMGMVKILERLANVEKECLRISQQIISDPLSRDELKVFVEHVGYSIGGNHRLSTTASRYNNLE